MSVLPAYALGDGRFEASAALEAVPLIPRNLGLSLLHAYRATISHTYGDVCKYYRRVPPTPSAPCSSTVC